MDTLALRNRIEHFLKKYRYFFLVLLLGLALMAIPGKGKTEQPEVECPEQVQTAPDTGQQLAEILSGIEGAGKVRVLLTHSAGEEVLYQTDEDISTSEGASTIHRDTVTISDGSRAQQGLIRQVLPPQYQGAIVLCQGADRPAVRLAIVEAVANATGLGTNRISVIKMK